MRDQGLNRKSTQVKVVVVVVVLDATFVRGVSGLPVVKNDRPHDVKMAAASSWRRRRYQKVGSGD